jgi:hypothetical protein
MEMPRKHNTDSGLQDMKTEHQAVYSLLERDCTSVEYIIAGLNLHE